MSRHFHSIPVLLLLLAMSPLAAAAAPEFLNSGKVLGGDMPFSEAVRHGDTLYLSGQLGITPRTMTLVAGGFRPEAMQLLANLRTILEANGRGTQDVIRCTVMLADMADWPAFNEIWRTVFQKPFPARTAIGVQALALGARVELECLASAGS
ncbi:MAG: Rid family hydrolase [Pseudomonadota bacterium]